MRYRVLNVFFTKPYTCKENTIMFMKPGYKIMTPETARKEMKRKATFNWIMFFSVLLMITIGVLELITMNTR